VNRGPRGHLRSYVAAVTTRPRLRSLDLTGPRATIRRTAFIALIASAVVAAIGFVLPAHRLVYVPSSGAYIDLGAQPGETSFHSLLADGGPLSIVALLTAAAFVAMLMRSRRLGAGMLAGLLAAGGAVLAIGPIILVHLFSKYETAIGNHLFAIGELVLLFVGAGLVIAEPILYLLERRRIERASRPAPLPVARIASPA
jgi:hypothetical protein